MIFEWSKLFSEPDALHGFKDDLFGLAKAMYDLMECPQGFEDQTDFIAKVILFVQNNEEQINYIRQILESEDEDS